LKIEKSSLSPDFPNYNNNNNNNNEQTQQCAVNTNRTQQQQQHPSNSIALSANQIKKQSNIGEQDGSSSDKYDIWSRFAAQFSDVVCHSYSLLSHEAMLNMGKLLPLTVARQTGILGKHQHSVSNKSHIRKQSASQTHRNQSSIRADNSS
jgi:hypothetical protein